MYVLYKPHLHGVCSSTPDIYNNTLANWGSFKACGIVMFNDNTLELSGYAYSGINITLQEETGKQWAVLYGPGWAHTFQPNLHVTGSICPVSRRSIPNHLERHNSTGNWWEVSLVWTISNIDRRKCLRWIFNDIKRRSSLLLPAI